MSRNLAKKRKSYRKNKKNDDNKSRLFKDFDRTHAILIGVSAFALMSSFILLTSKVFCNLYIFVFLYIYNVS